MLRNVMHLAIEARSVVLLSHQPQMSIIKITICTTPSNIDHELDAN